MASWNHGPSRLLELITSFFLVARIRPSENRSSQLTLMEPPRAVGRLDWQTTMHPHTMALSWT